MDSIIMLIYLTQILTLLLYKVPLPPWRFRSIRKRVCVKQKSLQAASSSVYSKGVRATAAKTHLME